MELFAQEIDAADRTLIVCQPLKTSHHMKKLFASGLIMMSLTGCACAQNSSLKIELYSMKVPGTNTAACELFWNITNQTGLNITTINFQTVLKEADGSILNSMSFQTARLKNEEEVSFRSLVGNPCQEIKTIKFGPVFLLFVDGKSRRDLMSRVGDSVVFTSKVNAAKVIP
jgi:hypothetical protein